MQSWKHHFWDFQSGSTQPRPQTEILMLIAGEVGTKSKWAIPRELYFQMVPNGSQWTLTFLFLLQTQNHKYLCTVDETPFLSPSRVYFNILSKIGMCFFHIIHLIFVHFKVKENLDNWSQNILIERSEQVLNSRICLKLFWLVISSFQT